MQGVEPGGEFSLQGVVDRPVAVQPGHGGKGGGADLYRIMCLAAGRCARVTVVEMRLVHYIKQRGVKGGNESGTHALAAACQFLRH